MARVIFTPLVEEIVGKLAGSVFQDSYGGFQVRTRVTPRNPQTTYQQLRRGEFGFLSAGWRSLTPTERQTFIDNAASPGGGLNLYLQANINLALLALGPITTYVPSTAPSDLTVDITELTPEAFKIQATGGATFVPLGTNLLVYATGLRQQSQIFSNPSMYSPIANFPQLFPLVPPIDILSAYNSRFGQITDPKRLCVKTVLIDTSNGNRGPESIVCANTQPVPVYYIPLFTQNNLITNGGSGSSDMLTWAIPANTFLSDGDKIIFRFGCRQNSGGGNNSVTTSFGGTGIAWGNQPANATLQLELIYQRTDADTVQYTATVARGNSTILESQGEVNGLDFTAAINFVFNSNSPGGSSFNLYVGSADLVKAPV